MSDVRSFLDQSSGNRYAPWKWSTVGTVLSGKLLETPRVVNRPNLTTGLPEDQLVVSIETSDGQQWALWVRHGFLATAISDAVKESGATGLAAGGTLHVKHSENRDIGKPQPARVFKARYEPPKPSTVNPADVFGQDEEPF